MADRCDAQHESDARRAACKLIPRFDYEIGGI
jgi:hypothetical protein